MRLGNNELKPCPFCGQRVTLASRPAMEAYGISAKWFVYCPSGCCRQYESLTKERAIEMWNERKWHPTGSKKPLLEEGKWILASYKGYAAKIIEDKDEDQPRWHGMVMGIADLLAFDGDTQDEAVQSFHDIIDDYLETCEEIGKQPDKGSDSIAIDKMDSRPLEGYLDTMPKPRGIKEKLLVAFSNFLDTCGEVADLLKNYDDSHPDADA